MESPGFAYDDVIEYDSITADESSLDRWSSGRFERGDTAKRNLVYGFVRECWRTMLQFNGFAFPDDTLMSLLV